MRMPIVRSHGGAQGHPVQLLCAARATLNFGYFTGDIDDPDVHSIYFLFAAVVANLIATALKLRDRSHAGATQLATSLVARLHLITGATVWAYSTDLGSEVLSREMTASVVSLSGGALFANVVSIVLLAYGLSHPALSSRTWATCSSRRSRWQQHECWRSSTRASRRT